LAGGGEAVSGRDAAGRLPARGADAVDARRFRRDVPRPARRARAAPGLERAVPAAAAGVLSGDERRAAERGVAGRQRFLRPRAAAGGRPVVCYHAPSQGAAMRLLAAAVVASLALTAVPARAQDVISKESAAELKASVLGDLETLHTKFVGLAQEFPQEKYTWTPMEGVRSVADV